jgi:hypothetical protein
VLNALPGDAAEHGDGAALERFATRVRSVCDALAQAGRAPLLVLFAHPVLAESIPADVAVVCAWSGDVAMQRAAARWLSAMRGA